MEVHLRYIGRAVDLWEAQGRPIHSSQVHFDMLAVQRGDVVRHPGFPHSALIVILREVDLGEQALTLYLDLAPDSPPSTATGAQVIPIRT